MTYSRRKAQDRAEAEQTAVSNLLRHARGTDFLTKMSLEDHLKEMTESGDARGLEQENRHASATLIFGGNPVFDSEGIEAEFGAGAISVFQDLVSKMHAKGTTGLGQKGPVANKDAATLHITDIVRGSFGFLLEEPARQGKILDTSLKGAVDQTLELLGAFGDSNEEKFRALVGEADQRILTTVRGFFALLNDNKATFKLIANDQEMQLSGDDISRGCRRANETSIEEIEGSFTGNLDGVLPGAHQFEFTPAGAATIRGKVDSVWSSADLERWNRELVGRRSSVTMLTKRVTRNGAVAGESYLLKSIAVDG